MRKLGRTTLHPKWLLYFRTICVLTWLAEPNNRHCYLMREKDKKIYIGTLLLYLKFRCRENQEKNKHHFSPLSLLPKTHVNQSFLVIIQLLKLDIIILPQSWTLHFSISPKLYNLILNQHG